MFWLSITSFSQQHVRQNDYATHDGSDGNFFRFAGTYKLMILFAEIMIEANGDQRRHVDCSPE